MKDSREKKLAERLKQNIARRKAVAGEDADNPIGKQTEKNNDEKADSGNN
ncbi:MAG: hypothetical protein J0G32_00385 [Alphaproteobacteria bacterium]|nr:hypothetical protein [Alphaproteobacteria bacterium]